MSLHGMLNDVSAWLVHEWTRLWDFEQLWAAVCLCVSAVRMNLHLPPCLGLCCASCMSCYVRKPAGNWSILWSHPEVTKRVIKQKTVGGAERRGALGRAAYTNTLQQLSPCPNSHNLCVLINQFYSTCPSFIRPLRASDNIHIPNLQDLTLEIAQTPTSTDDQIRNGTIPHHNDPLSVAHSWWHSFNQGT